MKTWLFYSQVWIFRTFHSIFAAIAFTSRVWQCAPMPHETPNTSVLPMSWQKLSVLGGVFPAFLVGLDQWSKWATTRFFDLPMGVCATADPNLTHDVTPILDLSLLCNRGISWGMLQGDSSIKRWLLTIFAFLMTVVLFYVLRKTSDRLGQFSISLVIAGAVGNAIDRLFFGAVTDMIDASDIGFNYVFNVADSYITVGVIGLFLSSYLTEKREKAAVKAAEE